MLFWSVSFVAAAAVALILGRAFGRGAGDAGAALAVYRDQLTEIDRDLARGTLTEAEAERVRLEVSRRLLAADRAARAGPGLARGPRRGAALATAVLVVGLALGGYAWLGAPGSPTGRCRAACWRRRQRRPAGRRRPRPRRLGTPFTRRAGYRSRASRPDRPAPRRGGRRIPSDPKGLDLLARNETETRQFQGRLCRRGAADRGARRRRPRAGDHAQLAELMVLAAGGLVSPEAEAALVEALTLDQGEPHGAL